MRKFFVFIFPLSIATLNWFQQSGVSYQKISSVWFFPCPLKFFFGIDCPACGLTRSTLAALCLDFNISLSYHFLGIPLAIFSVFFWLILVLNKENVFLDILQNAKKNKYFNECRWLALGLYLISFFSRKLLF